MTYIVKTNIFLSYLKSAYFLSLLLKSFFDIFSEREKERKRKIEKKRIREREREKWSFQSRTPLWFWFQCKLLVFVSVIVWRNLSFNAISSLLVATQSLIRSFLLMLSNRDLWNRYFFLLLCLLYLLWKNNYIVNENIKYFITYLTELSWFK